MLMWGHMRVGRIAAAFAMMVAAGGVSAADEPFYRGKRITLVINYAAGGPTDIEGRLFAKHIVKHLDAPASLIVQNMDGAGGLIGTNYLGEIAPKDGTSLGYFTGQIWRSINDPAPRRVDFKTYQFVAYQPGTTVYFARTDIKPGLKAPVDFGKAENVISGGLGADNAKDLLLRLGLDMLGLKYKYVTSYRGSQAARLALQQNEINYYAESPPSYRSLIEPTLVKTGEVIPLFYDPGYDGETFRTPRQMEGVDMMSFPQFYEKIKGAPPSGPLWDVYRTILAANGAMQRLIVMPPGVPREAVEAMTKAIEAVEKDPDYVTETEKVLGYQPEFVTGPQVNDRVRRQLSIPTGTREFLANYVKNAPR
jgi:tripartite-type tricarboxylate transporter receptor subunit TctC